MSPAMMPMNAQLMTDVPMVRAIPEARWMLTTTGTWQTTAVATTVTTVILA